MRMIIAAIAVVLVSTSALAQTPRAKPALTGDPIRDIKAAVTQGAVNKVGTDIDNSLNDLISFFKDMTDEDLGGASTLAMQIPELQDPTGKACWDTLRPIGTVIKSNDLFRNADNKFTLKLATDIEAFRLFNMAIKNACKKPECTQVWSDVANQITALGSIPIPGLSIICSKIP